MKKLVFLALILVLMLSMSIACFSVSADEGYSYKTNWFEINDAIEGTTYKAYKILDLELSTYPLSFAYKLNDKWADFFETTDLSGVNIDENGYVTVDNSYYAPAFRTQIKKYLQNNEIEPEGSVVATSSKAVIEGLEPGYYFINTSLGSLGILDSFSAVVYEKSELPTIDKLVNTTDDPDHMIYGKENTVNVGDVVNFYLEFSEPIGSVNLVAYDFLGEGFELIEDSIKINCLAHYQTPDSYDHKCTIKYDVATDDGRVADFAIYTNDEYGIVHKEYFVEYQAIVTEDAVVSGANGELKGNVNTAYLAYGEGHKTPEKSTNTYTFEFALNKYATDYIHMPLAGAEFILYRQDSNGSESVTNYATFNSDYTVTGWTTDKEQATVINTRDAAVNLDQTVISGLDEGVYFLEEIKAPTGYLILGAPVQFEITAADTDETEGLDIFYVKGYDTESEEYVTLDKNNDSLYVLNVENKRGSELPSTGGIGTYIFYVVGAVLVLGAGVTIIVRKRMKTNK